MSNNPFRASMVATEVNAHDGAEGAGWQRLDPFDGNGERNGSQGKGIMGNGENRHYTNGVKSTASETSREFPEVHTTVGLSSQVPEVNDSTALSSTASEARHHSTVLSSVTEYDESTGSSATGDDSNTDSLPEAFESMHFQEFRPQKEVVVNSHRAHVPSVSHIRKESLPHTRPTPARALSSHIPEVDAPQMSSGDAFAEALRRLGKVDRGPKPLRRRGSNESLSSLISYSIRRPSISAKADSGHTLESLATVLEDAAREGNLPLVEAVMTLGAHPVYRSTNRLRNRRHDALNKATAAGHVHIVDYLLENGAEYGWDKPPKKDPFNAIDYKVLDVAYAGHGQVAKYLITQHGANPFVEQWPRQHADAYRTIYRRVNSYKVYQRSLLDAIAKMGNQQDDDDRELLMLVIDNPAFDPTRICTRIYEDTPYEGDGTRMSQSTYHYSVLSSFVKAGCADAVERMLKHTPSPTAYRSTNDKTMQEEGQIPSTINETYIYPTNALSKYTYLYQSTAALRILTFLIQHNFSLAIPQKTADDSAPRIPLSRAILANSSDAVNLILKAAPELAKQEISFRLMHADGKEAEYRAQPLAAAIIQGSLDSARAILQNGANPADPAFGGMTVMSWAAGHSGSTAVGALHDMCPLASNLIPDAIQVAIAKIKPDTLKVLLWYEPAWQQLRDLNLWDEVLCVRDAERNEDVKRRYISVIDLVAEIQVHVGAHAPSQGVVERAGREGNGFGVQRLRDVWAL